MSAIPGQSGEVHPVPKKAAQPIIPANTKQQDHLMLQAARKSWVGRHLWLEGEKDLPLIKIRLFNTGYQELQINQ